MADKRIRLAIIGGQRGGSFNVALAQLKDRVKLSALCDPDPQVRAHWSKLFPGILAYDNYDNLLREDTCDAVLVATPLPMHASQSIQALKAGRHVLSEVTAVKSHQEALDLVAAVNASDRVYMMGENYTYARPHLMILNMVRKGLFGELTYAMGAYIHDCRGICFDAKGELTWRGAGAKVAGPRNGYPTHSLGPIAQWMDLGNSDSIDSVMSMESPTGRGMAHYAGRRFGKDNPAASPSYWSKGDNNVTLIKTKLGKLIELRIDTTSARPHHMKTHELQGTTACYITSPDHRNLIWIDGKSPGTNPSPEGEGNAAWGTPMKWEELEKHQDEFDDPRWRDAGKVAIEAGHGGGDYFELVEFIDAIEGAPNPIDVYSAVEWSSISWLSAESIRAGAAVKAFDYRSLAKVH